MADQGFITDALYELLFTGTRHLCQILTAMCSYDVVEDSEITFKEGNMRVEFKAARVGGLVAGHRYCGHCSPVR